MDKSAICFTSYNSISDAICWSNFLINIHCRCDIDCNTLLNINNEYKDQDDIGPLTTHLLGCTTTYIQLPALSCTSLTVPELYYFRFRTVCEHSNPCIRVYCNTCNFHSPKLDSIVHHFRKKHSPVVHTSLNSLKLSMNFFM